MFAFKWHGQTKIQRHDYNRTVVFLDGGKFGPAASSCTNKPSDAIRTNRESGVAAATARPGVPSQEIGQEARGHRPCRRRINWRSLKGMLVKVMTVNDTQAEAIGIFTRLHAHVVLNRHHRVLAGHWPRN